ncbi:DUF3055 domain-containing protein [Paenibacillus filicis]|uniref:DUF3055 domain-containing protein n=1 Tax=Paenibacillus gyeongsangnamensis TaxID=3388067 RepID=A0ABT4QI40_9BACL|nr:DUF3055 domain-containing protein [Paenibacillus filicis]MCZ8516544.1 DUF3055 domain-containing protein [Paenibacillus filicis]
MTELDYLYDGTEETKTRFVCFVGETLRRFDLAITTTSRFYGKKLVTDMQSGRTAVIGPDDLEEEGYLEHVYKLNGEEAAELRSFLEEVIGPVHFTDL